MNRRTFLGLGAGAFSCALAARRAALAFESEGSGLRFKYSICNEVFEKWDFAAACKAIRQAGYTGIEIAPFTLAENVDDISAPRRRELRGIMRSEGLAFAGLHWLLLTPKWLQVVSAD